jgi:hypothetical protein
MKKICSICKKKYKVKFPNINQKSCSKECSKQAKKEYHKNYRQEHKQEITKYQQEHKKEAKQYYKINKEQILQRYKIYRQNHKKEIKNYRLEHKEEIKQYHKNYKERRTKHIKNRKKTDINFRLSCYLRTRVWSALKGINKSKSTIKLLGCSIEKLKKHLEKHFKPRMSWANYGKWHIDHIRPCASFDLSKPSEQFKCFNYKNLRPLWKAENLSRSKKSYENG